MTIFFWLPDTTRPAGGIRIAYRAVDALNAAGIPAAIMHQRRAFRATWFDSDTRIVAAQSTPIFENDVLVLSELDAPRLLSSAPDVTKVVFNQNHRWTFVPGHTDYRRDDVAAMVVVSEDGERYMRYAYPGLRVERLRLGVDMALFRPAAEREPILLHHETKGALGREIALAMGTLRGSLDGWRLQPVAGLSQRAFASLLGRSAALITASQEEGFPLLLVEAMASGCAVVGYPAGGAAEYLAPDVSWPVAVGDHLGLARAVEQFVREWTDNRAGVLERTSAARALVETRYTLAHEAEDIVRIFGPIADLAASRPRRKACSVAELSSFEVVRRRAHAAARALVKG